jgi:hypothetical protein
MVLSSPPSRHHLAREDMPHLSLVVPLNAVGLEKTSPSGLPNQTVRFLQFQAGASGSCSFHVETHFWLLCEHESPLERVTREPRLDSPARFEPDRSGAQSKV